MRERSACYIDRSMPTAHRPAMLVTLALALAACDDANSATDTPRTTDASFAADGGTERGAKESAVTSAARADASTPRERTHDAGEPDAAEPAAASAGEQQIKLRF